MKKFLSIMMITLMIIVTIVGITACTKDEPDKEPDKLVGTWISVAEDNNHYPYDFNKTEEYRLYADYYAVITESENLFFKSYMFVQSNGNFIEHNESKVVRNPKKEGTYHVSTHFWENHFAGSSYKITFVDNDTILIEDDDDSFTSFTFRRTSMTLEEFKATYGRAE